MFTVSGCFQLRQVWVWHRQGVSKDGERVVWWYGGMDLSACLEKINEAETDIWVMFHWYFS